MPGKIKKSKSNIYKYCRKRQLASVHPWESSLQHTAVKLNSGHPGEQCELVFTSVFYCHSSPGPQFPYHPPLSEQNWACCFPEEIHSSPPRAAAAAERTVGMQASCCSRSSGRDVGCFIKLLTVKAVKTTRDSHADTVTYEPCFTGDTALTTTGHAVTRVT